MNFGRNQREKQPEEDAFEPGPELQIVPQTPEVKRIPPEMAEINIDEFLKQQGEIDKQKRDKKGPELH